MEIYVLGDIHGTFRLINEYKLRDCNVIQVGDFGLGFTSTEKDLATMIYWNTSWKARGIHVYALRGNHDNPAYWEDDMFKLSNLTLVKDYTVLELEGKKILCIGGAISIDRTMRTLNKTYWEKEAFDYDEEKLNKVLADNDRIDVVITHTCPEFCYPALKGGSVAHFAQYDEHLILDLQLERQLVARAANLICDKHKPEKWYYGHMHESKTEIIEGVTYKLLGIGEITNL